jgi:hypothetical protein
VGVLHDTEDTVECLPVLEQPVVDGSAPCCLLKKKTSEEPVLSVSMILFVSVIYRRRRI